MLISNLTYIEGRQLKQPMKINNLIPDYLGIRENISNNKTLEEQQKEFSAFAAKLKAMSKQ